MVGNDVGSTSYRLYWTKLIVFVFVSFNAVSTRVLVSPPQPRTPNLYIGQNIF